MTGNGSVDNFNGVASKEGSGCYLVKPVTINLLIKTIITALAE